MGAMVGKVRRWHLAFVMLALFAAFLSCGRPSQTTKAIAEGGNNTRTKAPLIRGDRNPPRVMTRVGDDSNDTDTTTTVAEEDLSNLSLDAYAQRLGFSSYPEMVKFHRAKARENPEDISSLYEYIAVLGTDAPWEELRREISRFKKLAANEIAKKPDPWEAENLATRLIGVAAIVHYHKQDPQEAIALLDMALPLMDIMPPRASKELRFTASDLARQIRERRPVP